MFDLTVTANLRDGLAGLIGVKRKRPLRPWQIRLQKIGAESRRVAAILNAKTLPSRQQRRRAEIVAAKKMAADSRGIARRSRKQKGVRVESYGWREARDMMRMVAANG